ncbi:hypothetical protein B0T25DRAFT_581540 [Lasiosphaeria hispida]|uniref:Heterokaryon incompatibility domain-containing protein n=1 Tax=Lasiosphaeria hispida TaxID=260671 RepID=A0AAJ0HJM9_9PEZI|nr:hypothetical protein B0T25DRAFT_581540 [Lasiosphaeria hispida]
MASARRDRHVHPDARLHAAQGSSWIYGIVNSSFRWSTGTSATLKGLLEEKWCRSDATIMVVDFNIDSQYYLTAADSPGEDYRNAHAWCSAERCIHKLDESKYMNRHAPGCVDQECEAAFAEAGLSSLLVDTGPCGTPEKPGQPGTPLYVAIPHVWADGMGNPRENRLPDCQLARIQAMVDNLDFLGRDPSSPVAFWMDTLCIPMANKHKALRKECIRSMRLIYSEASAVLALDAWMQQVPLAAPAPDRSIRFYTCAWLRRLWTFQKGILNRNMFLRFQDGAQGHQSLLHDVQAWESNLRTTRGTHVGFPSDAVTKTTLHLLVIADMVGMVAKGDEGPATLSEHPWPTA